MTNSEDNEPKLPPPPPPWVNKMIMWMLRSSLHRFVSKSIMLITVTGRKSGKKYTLPVTYVQDGDKILCSTDSLVRSWWKNLKGGAEVTMLIQRQEVTGHAMVIYDDPEAVAQGVEQILTLVPRDAKYYDVRLDAQKRPLSEDIARAAQRRVIVQVQL